MGPITNKQLIEKAKSLVNPKQITDGVDLGNIGCALVSGDNNLYVGVSIHACCGIGFCAESSAIASMVTNTEYRIKKIVAVSSDGILPPCGRCRELMYQINEKNIDTEIIIGKNKVVKLKNLLPYIWQKVKI